MFVRLSVALLLFGFLTVAVAAQGTPGGKTPIFTGFIPLTEKELKDGVIRIYDGFTSYGWKDITKKQLLTKTFMTKDDIEDTPQWFFYDLDENDYPIRNLTTNMAAHEIIQPGAKTSLFDGKTLTGWTLRGKAEASVQDGAIRLTNGSGSLESEGKYGDFILQLEYMTPVREEQGVNSGVFFRCIPGETMNGYECQILNKAGEKDYKSFIGTDTGGIFRRQVGRNVGPKDGVWNYLTIAVKGNRIATWVNGIQTANWTDERKPHNNPRNGCRTEAGTIQFQGHDPSTEIWFRNIRIREL